MSEMKFKTDDVIQPRDENDREYTGVIISAHPDEYEVKWSDAGYDRHTRRFIENNYELLEPDVEWKFKPGDTLIEQMKSVSPGMLPARRVVEEIADNGYILAFPNGPRATLPKGYVEDVYELDAPAEPKYTLEEAKQKLREEECNLHGHSYDAIMTYASNDPILFVCGNGCGKSWKVVSDGE